MVDQLPIRERQDGPIFNAIEAKNFKQALKLIDKRLSKKHTDYLEALKIYIRSKSPLVSEKQAVFLHLEEFVEKKRVITDEDTLKIYDEALKEVIPDSPQQRVTWARLLGELYWQVVKASPKDEDLGIENFKVVLKHDDWDHARQIANSLEKNFPKIREYIFWNITSMYLCSLSPNCPETQKKIWGGLALGQLGKLATATSQASDQKKLPLRSIQTSQELLLLLRITETNGKPEQRLVYLKDPNLGPESAAAKGEWELWRMKLRLMEEAHKWQELFDITGPLLTRARTKNGSGQFAEAQLSDWIVWESYIRSAVELGDNQYTDKVRSEVEAHLDPACGIDKSWKRNASLAWVKLAFVCTKPFSEGVSDQTSIRVLTVLKYLEDYGDASTAYNDMRPFVEQLDADERAQISSVLSSNDNDDLSTAKKITRHINSLKFEYLLIASIPEYGRRQVDPANKSEFRCISCTKCCTLYCSKCLARLAEKSINSYRTAIDDDGTITKNLLTTDRHPADDLCVLAAICLIKLSLNAAQPTSEPLAGSKTSYLLQATALLEYGWTHSKSNFQISLMLIRLYVSLGCGSLAMRSFQRLALKQVQLDTLSYTLMDRISSFHPHPFSHSPDGTTQFNSPIDQLKKQQKLYTSSRDHITRNTSLSFKHGSYNSILEIREVSETLSHTLSAAMSVIERRKIHRLIEPSASSNETLDAFGLLPPNAEHQNNKFIDTNDYDTFPNFEHTKGPRFEKLSRVLPGPSAHRHRANLIAQKLFLIVAPSSDASGEGKILRQWLIQHLDSQKHAKETSKMGSLGNLGQMTRAEELAQFGYDSMLIIIREACDKELWNEPGFEEKLENYFLELCENIEESIAFIEKMKTLVPAFAVPLNSLYAGQELGRTTVDLCDFIAGEGKDAHPKAALLSKTALELGQKLLQTVVGKCMIIKKGLDEGGWIDKVLGSTLPGETRVLDELEAEVSEELGKLIDENFMEEWAGEVVESWQESTVGFSYLRVTVN